MTAVLRKDEFHGLKTEIRNDIRSRVISISERDLQLDSDLSVEINHRYHVY